LAIISIFILLTALLISVLSEIPEINISDLKPYQGAYFLLAFLIGAIIVIIFDTSWFMERMKLVKEFTIIDYIVPCIITLAYLVFVIIAFKINEKPMSYFLGIQYE